jgi:hypothetical protein
MGAPEKPGYLAYQPDSYQVLNSERDSSLDKILAAYPAAATTAQPLIVARVRTPNLRMRTRLCFALVPLADVTIDPNVALTTSILIAATGSLWLATRQRAQDNTRQSVPTRNLTGTKSPPLAIPTDPGLWGYEWEGETNGQEIYCSFKPPRAKVGNTVAAAWHLCVNYEAVQRLSAEEWNQMRQRYGIVVGEPVVLT